jgi:hypothetical protein
MSAQKFDICSAASNPPSEVSLSLSLKNGQTSFQQGEIVTLLAQYSARKAKEYLLNNRSYDRSGRLEGMEVFCFELGSGADPLADYFNSAMGFIAGGLFSEQQLDRSPHTIELDLNEWRTLPPGSYQVSIVGNRVSMGTEGDWKSWNGSPIPLRSNPVSFRVERADSGWQRTQLTAAIAVLDAPHSTESGKRRAARILRFLGSDDSTRELVRRYLCASETFIWDFEAGLYGSPYRSTAIREMRAVVEAARGRVPDAFIDTLVTLELQSDSRYRPKIFERV